MKIQSHRHCRSAIGYHFVFVTKWRRRVFAGKVEMALKRIFSEVAARNGYALEVIGVDGNHAHAFITAAPSTSPSEIAKKMKGASSRQMRAVFPWLERRLGPSLWSSSYFVSTVGAVSEGAVRRYIETQGAAS